MANALRVNWENRVKNICLPKCGRAGRINEARGQFNAGTSGNDSNMLMGHQNNNAKISENVKSYECGAAGAYAALFLPFSRGQNVPPRVAGHERQCCLSN